MDITTKIKRQMHGQKNREILIAQGQSLYMRKPSPFPAQNPIGDYYGGKGKKVMRAMKKRYGSKKGKSVFYATAKKRGLKA